jgi:iron(III) transport system ATP-binding protein
LRDWKAGERRARVVELLKLIGLEEYAQRYPHQISGGQQQRVALARALAPRPRLLLLDEPFSNLDVTLREDLAREMRTILLREGTSGLLVSHDQFEAFAFADEIGVLHQGRLLQWDSAYNLYHRPADRFVANFIGQGVLLPADWVARGRVSTELGDIDGIVVGSRLRAPGEQVEVLVRPDDVVHDDEQPADGRGGGASVSRRGVFVHPQATQRRAVAVSGCPAITTTKLGQRIGIRLDIDHLVVFQRVLGAMNEA